MFLQIRFPGHLPLLLQLLVLVVTACGEGGLKPPVDAGANSASSGQVDCQSEDDGVKCAKDKHCFGGSCETDECGDGLVNGAESCDDGNRTWGDGCGNDCLQDKVGCTNGAVDDGEECDDGNWIDNDKCSNRCVANRCGNGRVDADEECDDGNAVDADACSRECRIVECRNSRVDPGEECDDGNNVDRDACTNTCRQRICGNSKLEPYEECDDGNGVDNDACTNMCTKPVCGNGIVEPGEVCDGSRLVREGGKTDRKGCSADCQRIVEEDECEACLKSKCNSVDVPDLSFWVSQCFGTPQFTEQNYTNPLQYAEDCTAVVQCAMRSRCVKRLANGLGPNPSSCYCGSTADETECAVKGPASDSACKREFQIATQSESNEAVLGNLAALEYASGAANALLECMYDATICQKQCAPDF